jgi:elongation factor P
VSIPATQIKVGNVIMHNGKPHRVTNVLHVTPGNWRGMVQTRLVNIETGSNAEHRFRSEDKVEHANMEHHSLQFSYQGGNNFIELKVVETTPSLRGATAAASPKPAKLETGLEIKVPQYVQTGDKVKIDTRTDEFIERV